MVRKPVLLLLLLLVPTLRLEAPEAAAAGRPISIAEFGRLMASLSEPEGYFDTDNFVSNEAAYLRVLPALRRLGLRGGAYLGVGPDQNYSYIATIEPRLALIVDIRRQNTMEHLYFKSLFALSRNRVEYVERLFGRPLGAWTHLDRAPIGAILARVDAAPRSPTFAAARHAEATTLVRSWQLPLALGDFRGIDYVARAFFEGGPDLKFTSYHREPRPHHPSYRQLLEETDGAGVPASYLADEGRFQAVRQLHLENRIIPVVGDFAGPHAFAAIAREMTRRGLALTCFYASNVEFYLFRESRWQSYLRNVNLLPRAGNACVIRAYANSWQPHPARVPGYYMTTVLQPLASFLAHANEGTYWDLVTRDCILK